MNGVAAVLRALEAHAPLTALVPIDNMTAGDLPLNFPLPALSAERVSGMDRNVPAPGGMKAVDERVQVTVYARSYPEQQTIQRLVNNAGDAARPTVAGIQDVVIHTAGEGPDFRDESSSIFLGTQDFRVRYNRAR